MKTKILVAALWTDAIFTLYFSYVLRDFMWEFGTFLAFIMAINGVALTMYIEELAPVIEHQSYTSGGYIWKLSDQEIKILTMPRPIYA